MISLRGFGAIATAFLLVACSEDDENPARRNRGSGTSTGNGSAADGNGGPGGGGLSCPAEAATPVQLGTEIGATDVHVAGNAVFFQVGTTLIKTGLDGTGRSEVYSSDDLVRTFTDGTTLVAVESPDPPNAVLRVGPVGNNRDELREVGTDLTAASVVVFGSDATSFYVVADNAGGDVLYRIGKEDGGLDTIVETDGVVSDPQIANGALWYVKNQTEIYKLALDGGGEPTMVTTVANGCSLAVGAANLYCSTNGIVEQRDLSGGNPTKVKDAQSSRVPVAFGEGLVAGSSLVVRSTGEGPLKSVLRSVAVGAESVLACGRDPIGALSASGTHVAWIEKGKGVFATTIR